MGRHLRNLLTALLGLIFGLSAGSILWAVFEADAQPQQAPPPCEAQLDQARTQNVQLRKAKAQSDFAVAATEEELLRLQKQLAEAEAKGKAAHAPAPPTEKK